MMVSNWTLFVEGKSDRVFMRYLLKHMGVEGVDVEVVGGGVESLRKVAPNMKRSEARGRRIAVVLDANSDLEWQRGKLERAKEADELPIEGAFFLPDDKRPGCLETLLREMAVPRHADIYDCFDRYKECLHRLDAEYQPPGPKAGIYAYCEAIGIKTGADRNYDPAYWNLDASALDPLQRFLRCLAG